MKLLASILFITISSSLLGQFYIDSLKIEAESEHIPEKRLKLLKLLSESYADKNETTSLYYAFEALKVASSLDDKESIADLYFSISVIQFNEAKNHEALTNADSAIRYFSLVSVSKRIADVYLHKEAVYDQLSDYPKALSMVYEALEIIEGLNDTMGLAMCYGDIGVIHYYTEEFETSLGYLEKSLNFYKIVQDTSGISSCYNNLANVYWEIGQEDKSLEYYLKGYDLDVLINNLEGQAASLCNLGEVYVLLGDLEKAEASLLKAYQISYDTDDKLTMVYALRGMANVYSLKGRYKNAIQNANKAVTISERFGGLGELSESYMVLSDVYKRKGDFEKSLMYYEKYNDIEDSIFSEENTTILHEMETKFRTEKILTENELLKKQGELSEFKTLEQEKRNYYLNIGLGLVLIFTLLILWSLLSKQKANKKLKAHKILVEERNQELKTAFLQIEEKNKEITASISYAKRIQTAILPDHNLLKENLGESFVLYKPKDIVAGDFYWVERKGGEVFFAAADCTGHGVPGAMVSVVCNNALNRAVREFDLTKPSNILDKVSDLVVEQFEKSVDKFSGSFLEETIKDGMDIALCSLRVEVQDLAKNSSTVATLQYAGANNPLWIVRDKDIIVTNPDKQPVGKFDKRKPFENTTINLVKGDTIYIFSDGFIDQFGGPKGKKYKSRAFKELLLSVQQLSMEEQKNKLNEAFENWRGDLEQIDDVCIIGVRI